VISGVGIGRNFSSMDYTTDGEVWNAPYPSPDFEGESQDAKVIMGVEHAFGLAGQYVDDHGVESNGLTATFDGGLTYKNYDCNYDAAYARYGSYPSSTTWFVALGIWPEDLEWDHDPEAVVLSRNIRRHKTKGIQFRHLMPKTEGGSRKLLQTYPYTAGIARTTDGGKTWTTVFNDTGNFYFNDIYCASTTQCWAVGESGSDSPTPGIRIIATTDGGNTWVQQFYVNNPEYSLMDISMINANEGWAAGGILARSITGTFFHTLDGGKTWTLDAEVPDNYATVLSFVHTTTVPSGYLGWASSLDIEGACSILAYK